MMEQDIQSMSIVAFKLLPTSVQSRLPALQSLRQSSSFSILSSRRRSVTPAKNIDSSDSLVEVQTAVASVTESGSEDAKQKLESLDTYNRENDSGVKWRYATQGMNPIDLPENITNVLIHYIGHFLQQSASQETTDVVFARKSYIDGVAYMLKALPDDLDDYETTIIRRALPQTLVRMDINGRIEGNPDRPLWLPSSKVKAFVHSTVQGFVTGFVLFAYLVLSFLASVIRTGAYYERQYNISQYIVSSSFVFAAALGKQSGAISEKVSAMSEGRVGKIVTDLAFWTVESVSAGVQDGIGQGLHLIEQRRNEK
ncbi:hypothetical protein M426DRAFT_200989 [Hypoxylon sp. CI-4A]|nr:hypothetical protein M426DRAFT_200989 [Hypoxylon sp. CI-4A]